MQIITNKKHSQPGKIVSAYQKLIYDYGFKFLY